MVHAPVNQDTIDSGSYDAANVEMLPADHELESAHDARLLRTGCFPWEVARDEFFDLYIEAHEKAMRGTRVRDLYT
jgi:hypothetical protein